MNTNKTLKVVIDCRVLQLATVDNRAKTGVYRYLSNLIEGLQREKGIKIYLHNCFHVRKSPIINTDIQNFKKMSHYINFPGMIDRFTEKYIYKNQYGFRAKIIFLVKPLIRLLSFIFRSIDNRFWENIHIYHSPYHPLDKSIRSKSVKKVITIYDLIPLKFPEFFENNNDHLIKTLVKGLHKEDLILSISESTKKDLLDYRKDLKSENVKVIYLAASKNLIDLLNETLHENVLKKYKIKNPYFISVCTIEPRKNLKLLIQSFQAMILENNDLELNLVLVGGLGWDYESIIESLNIANEYKSKIILTGFVNDTDLSILYSNALCFVYPSLYEGFGLPPLEAMQLGIPVIVSQTSSLPEVVGDSGIYIDPTSKEDLIFALKEMLKPNIRKKYANKSIERSSLFSWEKTVLQTIESYKNAIFNA